MSLGTAVGRSGQPGPQALLWAGVGGQLPRCGGAGVAERTGGPSPYSLAAQQPVRETMTMVAEKTQTAWPGNKW